jgi:hypothetical protein
MGRPIHRLSAIRLRNLPTRRVMLSDGGGLYLSVVPPNASSWIFRYSVDRQQRMQCPAGLCRHPGNGVARIRVSESDHSAVRTGSKCRTLGRTWSRCSQVVRSAPSRRLPMARRGHHQDAGTSKDDVPHQSKGPAMTNRILLAILALPIVGVFETKIPLKKSVPKVPKVPPL